MGRTEESVHPEPTFPDVVTRTGSTETRSASGAIGRCSPYSVIPQCFHATVESLRVKDAEPTGSGWWISAKTSSYIPNRMEAHLHICMPSRRPDPTLHCMERSRSQRSDTTANLIAGTATRTACPFIFQWAVFVRWQGTGVSPPSSESLQRSLGLLSTSLAS